MKRKQETVINGKEILARRQAKDITLTELAERAGVAKSYMYYIEREKKSPSMTVVVKIAKALGCTVDDLLKAG